MTRYVNIENFPKLFDEEYKKTKELISQGETHLDNLAEGFLEADRVLRKMPTADVVPKSEVDWNSIPVDVSEALKQRAVEKAKTDVAREIFEELVREVYSKIPDKILPVTFGEMSRHLDYNDGLNFGSRNAYFDTLKIIAELKKKYTEEQT